MGIPKWLLLECTSYATLIVDGTASVMRIHFFSIFVMVEQLVGRAFHHLLQLDIWLGLLQDLTPTGDILHQIFVY